MKHKWRMSGGAPDEWAWESGFHNGVYCERCGKTVCVHCHPDWEEMDDCEKYESEPQTNADRIRAMSDEELAEWLVKRTVYQESAFSAPSYLNFLTESDDTKESAIKGTVKWLKQPVKDGDNE